MIILKRHPYIAVLITIALIITVSSPVFSFPFQNNQSNQKKGSKDEKNNEKKKGSKDEKNNEKSNLSKQEREYIKIKQFSLQELEKSSDFKSLVEAAYRRKQREHSEYAFYINTRDAADEQIMRSGDKLKIEDTLYDNPLVQDYVNRVGHSLVPKDSKRLYAFKVTLNPIPEARSLSTGTVYVSSGLLSLVDNEAQLSYLLAHEIAHNEKDHWYEDVLVGQGMERYNERQEKKRNFISGIASIAAGPVARLMGGDPLNAWMASIFVESGLPTILKLAMPNAVFSWDKQQEDEADQLALKYMLQRNYDPREVPKFYANLQRMSNKDSKTSLGFIGDASRVVERIQQVDAELMGLGKMTISTGHLSVGALELGMIMQTRRSADALMGPNKSAVERKPDTGKHLDPSRDAEQRKQMAEEEVSGPLAADLNAKLDAGAIIGSSAEFAAVMAQLRRDNGIRAYYYDMFQMARDNLEESLLIRNNDPLAHFYNGKVLKLTARTGAEKRRAMEEFVRAIELDRRRVLPEARLHRALALLENNNTSETREVVSMLKDYVEIYRSEHGGVLPPNMDVIYDYFQEVGEMNWASRPATNVSEKIEPAVSSTPVTPRQPDRGGAGNTQPTPTTPKRKP
jgi:predicted Zn-dependent protease